jgi:hypothetical protein
VKCRPAFHEVQRPKSWVGIENRPEETKATAWSFDPPKSQTKRRSRMNGSQSSITGRECASTARRLRSVVHLYAPEWLALNESRLHELQDLRTGFWIRPNMALPRLDHGRTSKEDSVDINSLLHHQFWSVLFWNPLKKPRGATLVERLFD